VLGAPLRALRREQLAQERLDVSLGHGPPARFGKLRLGPLGAMPTTSDADVSQRFEFEDLDTAMNIRAGRPHEGANLHREWTDEVDWSPRVRMTMSSETSNRYFKGRENVAVAIARRGIKASGDIRASLALDRNRAPDLRALRRTRRDRVSAPRGVRRERELRYGLKTCASSSPS
jgi:hypothetical protein